MSFNEDAVRDSLSTNLELLEAGLKLDKKEKFVPNKHGTRSFIDLVAHDNNGRIVLIEVKKTKPAEREAIHEILKYVEGTKRHLGLKESEIRVFVVSPEWGELLIPFSSFVQRTTCDVVGFKLRLSSIGAVETAETVQPVEMFGERFIAPWHELRYYTEESSCINAIEEYKVACETKGIESYVLLELHPSNGHTSGIASPKQGTMRDAISMMAGAAPNGASLPLYQRALYFAMQQLSEQEYQSILTGSPHDTTETLEYLGEIEDEEERLLTLHEAVLNLKPRATADFLEIAYPAKLSARLLTEDGWEIGRVHRYGAFERSLQMLPDEQIVSEICGEEGASYQKFVKTFDPSNKAQIAEVEKGVDRCLSENPAWRKQIGEALREIAALKDTDQVEFNLFYPSTALLTFYLAVNHGEPEQYIPNYAIHRKVDDKIVLVFGCLVWDGSCATLKTVLQKHYNSSRAEMLHPLMWGGYDNLDSKVMQTIGFRYKTFRVDVQGDCKSFFALTEEGWESVGPLHPFEDFMKLYKGNEPLAREICDLYSKHWDGSMVDLSDLE